MSLSFDLADVYLGRCAVIALRCCPTSCPTRNGTRLFASYQEAPCLPGAICSSSLSRLLCKVQQSSSARRPTELCMYDTSEGGRVRTFELVSVMLIIVQVQHRLTRMAAESDLTRFRGPAFRGG